MTSQTSMDSKHMFQITISIIDVQVWGSKKGATRLDITLDGAPWAK